MTVVDAEWSGRRSRLCIQFPCQDFHTYRGITTWQYDNQIPATLTLEATSFPFDRTVFLFAAKTPFEHFVSLSADNYLAMEVACTLVCPRANQEVLIAHPDGDEMQKCEKCEGDCPKSRSHCVFVDSFAFSPNALFTCTRWPLHSVHQDNFHVPCHKDESSQTGSTNTTRASFGCGGAGGVQHECEAARCAATAMRPRQQGAESLRQSRRRQRGHHRSMHRFYRMKCVLNAC